MGMFDQSGRQASKLDGAPFFAWALGHFEPVPALVFERWDDTRRLTFAGGPDRTNDLVAVLHHAGAPERKAFAIVEIETEPERFIFQRLGGYELALSVEVSRNVTPEDEPSVGSILINLTGEQPRTKLELGLPGTGKKTWIEPPIINLQQDAAAGTLANIAAGRLGLAILPWIPLMAGGGQPALIEEWKRVTLTEPDANKREKFAALALVFAELTRELVNWQQALEGWQMRESQIILGWMAEGELKGILRSKRADLLEVLRVRFQDPVPESLRLAVEGTNDPDILDCWFKAALRVKTLAGFRAAMRKKA
jgi:hypothetical protein